MTTQYLTNKKIYFPGLNGIRFLAAMAVMVHHIEQFKYWEKIPSAWEINFIKQLGNKAVGMFFVLSGFLISYLLLVENKQNNNVDIVKFYVRRALRIWPLYLLTLLLMFFVLPHLVVIQKFGNPLDVSWGNFFMYLVFLPHVAIFVLPPVLGATQFWSVGIEENFYVVWPFIIKLFHNKLLTVFMAIVLIKFFGEILFYSLSDNVKIFNTLLSFWHLFQIELLVIGSIGAMILYHKKNGLTFIYKRTTQFFSYFLFVGLLFLDDTVLGLSLIEGLVFLTIVLNIATNPKSIVKLRGGILKKLGDVSYGIYLWHVGIITLVGYYLQHFICPAENLFLFNVLIYGLSCVFSIGTALFSYYLYEAPFLNLKKKFVSIKSSIQ